MSFTREQLEEDVRFLLSRSAEAGSCDFTNERWTGQSSNALVRFAYGGKQDCMPWDRGDYAACVRTVHRLPKHRRTPAVMGALRKARQAYLLRYPTHASALVRRAERETWLADKAARYAKERQRQERRAKRRAANQ